MSTCSVLEQVALVTWAWWVTGLAVAVAHTWRHERTSGSRAGS